MNTKFHESLVDRFLRYTSISSQSDMSVQTLPSSSGQMELAEYLKKELEEMKLDNIKLTDQAILTARLKGTNPNAPVVGFIAHLDTYDGGYDPNIKAQILKYTGEDLVLNKEKNIILTKAENPEIEKYVGQDILVSDGTSVLGADDKAAVAVVMTTLEYLIAENPHRGDIVVAFVPDEEIGLKGAKALDLSDFPADYAYTMDCCELGEVVYENVNAAACTIEIEGVVAHSMSNKGDRVNPILVGMDLIAHIDREEIPVGRKGAFAVREFIGKMRTANLRISMSDFDYQDLEARKNLLRSYIEQTQKMHPRAKITYEIFDFYRNMNEGIKDDRKSVDLIYQSMEEIGITPITVPMKGGTDGSCLSHRGIPTPNYFTGAHNFHSNFEFLPIPSFIKSLELTIQIIKNSAL